MNHIPYEKWYYYVRDELDEEVREQYDAHLYGCDQCLAVYLSAIEAVDRQMPMMTKESSFTDEVMHKVSNRKGMEQPVTTKKPNMAFHYIIAAAMTLILMSSGIFTQLVNMATDYESLHKSESSIVWELMDKSISIIDKVEKGAEEE